MSLSKVEKTVTLKPFKSDEYLIWRVQAEATFRVHGLLEIIKGEEIRPTEEYTGDASSSVSESADKNRILHYEQRHNRAYQALINCLETPEAIKVYSLNSAHAVWKRLEEEYGQISEIRRTTALQDLYSLRKNPSDSMEEHIRNFTRLQTLADYHRPAQNRPMDKEDINLLFLTTLGDEYKVYRQAMGTRVTAMTTAQLFAEFRALEMVDANEKTNGNGTTNQVLTLRGQSSGPGPGRQKQKHFNGKPYDKNKKGKGFKKWNSSMPGYKKCNCCGKEGHLESECFRYKKCNFCGKEGHLESECFKKKRERENRSKNETLGQHMISDAEVRESGTYGQPYNRAFCTKVLSSVNKRKGTNDDAHVWVVDSAANTNLTPHLERLKRYTKFPTPQLVTGLGGNETKAHGVGYVTLRDEEGRTHGPIRVLHVPDAEYPILSLMHLRRAGIDLQFTGVETYTITSKTTGFHLSGYAEDDILFVEDSCKRVSLMMTTRSAKNRRIVDGEDFGLNQREIMEKTPQPIRESRVTNDDSGAVDTPIRITDLDDITSATVSPWSPQKPPNSPRHTPPNLWHLRLGHASRITLSRIPEIKATYDSSHCQACIRAKSTKTPYYLDEYTANEKIAYIHSDTCGPFPTSFSKSIHYITFTCDYTRYVWVYPIPNKRAATIKDIFAKWKAEVELETGYKVKTIRTDGGGEYEREMTSYFESMGIKHLLTAPYSPQSNGTAERLNRTLNDMMRTILLNGNMPDQFWAEAAVHAAYIKNILPSAALKDFKTPFEMYHDVPPNYEHLKPFGSICYVSIPPQ